MSRRRRTFVQVLAIARIALAAGWGAAASACAASQRPPHTHAHCHLVEKHDGTGRPLHHLRVCHTHAHRTDHH
ncbi:MAG: hypothetical protein IPL61_05145 [Myxococcales bacterium]|nr:hypothetical protein [Myxococcales bacterium]